MDEIKGLWAVVITAGGKFIGNFRHEKDEKGINAGNVMDVWNEGNALTLHEAYEYLSGVVPMGNGQISKNAIALPIGAAMRGLPMMVKPCAITFFNDMEEDDKKQHFELVKKAREASSSSTRGGSILQPPPPGFRGFGPPGGMPGRG